MGGTHPPHSRRPVQRGTVLVPAGRRWHSFHPPSRKTIPPPRCRPVRPGRPFHPHSRWLYPSRTVAREPAGPLSKTRLLHHPGQDSGRVAPVRGVQGHWKKLRILQGDRPALRTGRGDGALFRRCPRTRFLHSAQPSRAIATVATRRALSQPSRAIATVANRRALSQPSRAVATVASYGGHAPSAFKATGPAWNSFDPCGTAVA